MALTKVTYSMIQGAVFNVLDFGAVGDNSNNDTTAIQTAIDAAFAAGGGVVYLPADKTFKVTASLVNKQNVTIRGEGFTSVIKSATNFKVFQQNTGVVAYDMAWENFRITGAATGVVASNHGINLFESERSAIRNMWFEELDGDGIYIRTNNVTVENIYCKNCYRQGIAVTDGDYISIDGVRGEGTMITLVDVEPNPGDQINYLSINDVEFYDPAIPALRVYHAAVVYDAVTKMTLSNIVSHGIPLQSIEGLVATNLTSRNTDSVESFQLFLCKDVTVNNVSITGTTSGTQEKVVMSSVENAVVNNVSIYGGANIEIDLLGLTNCTLSNFVMRNSGANAVRLRDSTGTTINGINLDGTITNALLLNPTTSLSKTIIKNAVVNGATNGLVASGTVNDIYIDGNLDGATTPINQSGVTTGYISVGVLGALRRNAFGFGAAPTVGTWNRGDIVWNSSPSAGGVPGWVCVASGTPGTWKAMAAVAA
jgi:hypothetical protein